MTRPGTAPLRAAIYARYSSENQREASIEDQLRICLARAQREGWRVAATFTDHAISGATALRPGYQALLGAMRAGEVDIVLAESLDRLSRDQEHVAGFYKQATFAGVRIVTLAEGEISELHVGLKGTMGALYLKDLADKGTVLLAGRTQTSDESTFGLVIFEAGTEEEARGIMNQDPAVANGVMHSRLYPYRVACKSSNF